MPLAGTHSLAGLATLVRQPLRTRRRPLPPQLGYRILARNVNLPVGELDLVALDGRTLVFVEVRSTEGANCERPTRFGR